MQKVGQTVDRDGLQARIAEDHLVEGANGGVAVVGGLHVGGEDSPHVGDPLQELDRLGLSEGLEVGLLHAMPHGIGNGRRLDALDGSRLPSGDAVPQRTTDLRGQLVVQSIDEVADVIGDVAHVEVLPPAIAGVENLLEVLADRDDRFVVGEGAVAEVVDRRHVLVRLDDPTGEFGQLLLDPDVGGHESRS